MVSHQEPKAQTISFWKLLKGPVVSQGCWAVFSSSPVFSLLMCSRKHRVQARTRGSQAAPGAPEDPCMPEDLLCPWPEALSLAIASNRPLLKRHRQEALTGQEAWGQGPLLQGFSTGSTEVRGGCVPAGQLHRSACATRGQHILLYCPARKYRTKQDSSVAIASSSWLVPYISP